MTLAQRLAGRIVVDARQSLPVEVAAKTRLHLADTLGISLAAMRTSREVGVALSAARLGGATGVCRVIGRAIALPPQQAAFVNSAAAHALDFDDVHDAARLHVSTVTLPAALAAADVYPAGRNRLLHALALGNDVMCRMGLAIGADATGPAGRWLLTQLVGYFGAAVAAGVVLELDEAAMTSALGLAYMQAAGGKETAVGVGANARPVYPGFATMGGLQAALLAHAGMTAPDSTLDGRSSFFQIYLDRALSARQTEQLLALEWPWLDTELKPWPCCRLSHPYVAAALELARQVEASPIEVIEIHVNASAATLCRPLEARIRPRTLADAKYSIPFVTALALTYGDVNLTVLNESTLADARVLALADKVRVVEGRPDAAGLPVGAVSVIAAGRRLAVEHELRHVWVDGAIEKKFADCLLIAGVDDPTALWTRIMHAAPEDLPEAIRGAIVGW